MSVLWTATEAIAATGGVCAPDWQATGVSIDSRTLVPGDLFVALSDARDGHDFVKSALDRGAVAALASHWPDDVAKDAPLLMVGDVLTALTGLARAARARMSGRVVAVTGSVGKTSCKDMLQQALARQGAVHAAHRSLNNHWGVPLTLARMPRDTDFAVIEIGMNHPGEIRPLSRLARPDVVLITTVAAVHMAAFSSLGEIALAKAEAFDGLSPGGVAVLNVDTDTFDVLAARAKDAHARIVTFGQSRAADFRLCETHFSTDSTTLKAEINGDEALLRLGAPGRHLAVNLLGVLAAVDATGGDMTLGALDLATWQPPDGRGARHKIRLDTIEDSLTIELIDDSYNANPASMAAAFAVLAAATPVNGVGRINKGRRLAFLTDMLELGPDEAALHAGLAKLASVNEIDVIHCAGPLMQHLSEALPVEKRGEWHESAEKLALRVHHLLDAGDVVMVKGSKGSRASRLVEAIKKLDRFADE